MADKGRRLAAPVGESEVRRGVLLEKHRTKTLSDVFTVVDRPVRIIAFGLTGDSVDVLRVWKSPSTGGWDNCGEMLPGGETYEQQFKLGCEEIRLSKTIPELVIDSVGDYRVQYRGDNRTEVLVVMMEDNIVTATDSMRGFCRCCPGG